MPPLLPPVPAEPPVSSEPLPQPFQVGDRVAFGFPARFSHRILAMKPYQGVPCGWMAQLENHGIPWVDASTLVLSAAPLKLSGAQMAPQRPLGAPPVKTEPLTKPAPAPVPPQPRIF
jgi:hypothetical protein